MTMNEFLLTGVVAVVTASAIWDFVKFLIARRDGENNSIADLRKAIADLTDKVERNQAILCRTHALRFDDELLNSISHSKEYFAQQLQDIDVYESYCAKHPDFKNSYATAAINHIRETYKKLLDEHRL